MAEPTDHKRKDSALSTEVAVISQRQRPAEENGVTGQSRLLEFPSELITKIVHQIDDPADALRFGLTCKAVWAHIDQTILFEIDAQFNKQENQMVGLDAHTANYRMPTIVWAIAFCEDLDTVKRVIDAYNKIDQSALYFGWPGTDDTPGWNLAPIVYAIHGGRLEVVQYLISKGLDVTMGTADPLELDWCGPPIPLFHVACRAKRQDIAIYLLNGQAVDSCHLNGAIRYNCPLVVEHLFQQAPFLGDDRISRVVEAFGPSDEDLEGIEEWHKDRIGNAMQAVIAATGRAIIGDDNIMRSVAEHMEWTRDPHFMSVLMAWHSAGRPGPLYAMQAGRLVSRIDGIPRRYWMN